MSTTTKKFKDSGISYEVRVERDENELAVTILRDGKAVSPRLHASIDEASSYEFATSSTLLGDMIRTMFNAVLASEGKPPK